MKRLQDKVALITGGNSGIGLATARRYLAEGAKVIITGRRPEALEEAAASLDGPVTAIRADMAVEADLEALFAQVGKEHGRIDVLFLNAGVAGFRPIEQVDAGDFEQQFGVNVRGPLLAVKHALPLLGEGSSVILNTSIVGRTGMPNTAVYAGTKGALSAIGRALASELAPRGIRVNSISPGPVATPIYDKLGMPAEAVQEFGASVLGQVPMGRFGQPDELAGVAALLASSDSSFLTGEEIVVDGGLVQA